MTWWINRCSHCGCDEPILNAIDGKLYCNNCGMILEDSSRKAEKEQGHTAPGASEKEGAGATQEKPVLPIPCTNGFDGWKVKDYFQKINEELDEMKSAILSFGVDLDCSAGQVYEFVYDDIIAEEAADTITAITSMLEAMGIDEQARQAAQRRVNEHNLKRGRFD